MEKPGGTVSGMPPELSGTAKLCRVSLSAKRRSSGRKGWTGVGAPEVCRKSWEQTEDKKELTKFRETQVFSETRESSDEEGRKLSLAKYGKDREPQMERVKPK